MFKTRIIFIFLLSYNIIQISTQTSERHLVQGLFPGLYDKEIYSGYLKTDVEGTELFYVFTPSQSSPEKDPIILWLNGGPGCSSMSTFLELVGPVIFIPNKKDPVLNEYPWNKNASIFYIDNIGGVGFSKIKDPKFYYDDDVQAVSLNIAIQNFFKIFSEYQNNTFYLMGLSYAGTYIPHLVSEMFKYMDTNPDAIKLKLKGFFIGNPYSYEATDWEDSMFDFSFSHALISFETYEKYLKECPHWPQIERIYYPYEESEDYKYDPIINKDELMPRRNVSKACNEARNETKMALEGINFYGILNKCPSNETIFELKKEFNNIDYDESNLHSEENAFKRMVRKNINDKYIRYTGRKLLNIEDNPENETEYAIDFFPSCNKDTFTSNFLNDNSTKEKLGVDLSFKFERCNFNINYKWGDAMKYYKEDIKEFSKNKNFTSWIYSGTEDMACVTIGTLRFINELNYSITDKWKQWKVDKQVAGMEQTYDHNLKFITVKKSGHSVISDQPKVSYVLFEKFLEFNRVDPEPEPEPEPSPEQRHLVNDLFNGLYEKEIYSGYLKTDVPGTELFYVFTPSQSSPENDPIILWLNGGPGCSSTTGLFEEIGPVIFIPNKKEPILNEYAWNKNASVFYIESPGGVGFSKLNDPYFYYNDEIQAVSLNIAIQNFFKIFPEYQNHSFYITGESYAGTYIPHLVTKMFKYMDDNPNAIKLNLKGFLIGNPYTFEDTDYEDSMLEFFFSHALISFETYEKYLKECPHWPQRERIYYPYEESEDYKYDPIINEDYPDPWKNVTKACNEARNETGMALKGINFYGILKECPSNDTIFELKKEFNNIDYDECTLHSEQNIFRRKIGENINRKYMRYTGSFLDEGDNSETQNAIDFIPGCGENYYTPNFLNDNTTKEKLGLDKSIKHKSCTRLNYKWGDSIYYYKNDIKELSKNKNFTSWLFSGTEDIAVTTLGTLRFINELNYTIKKKWKQWKVDGQVAGMEQTYDHNLKIITVKGVGHMVPEDNPKVAKILLDKFIEYNKYGPEPEPEPTSEPGPTSEPEPTSSTKPEPDGKGDKFPVWAIVIISVGSVIIILAVVFIILRARRKQNSMEEIEEKGKLLSEMISP